MIKLPLKRVIILFVDGKSYLCRVIHAGPDIVTCVDCYERIVTPNGVFYIEDGLQGKVMFDRNKVSGFKTIESSEFDSIYAEEREENEKLLREYIKHIAEEKRKKFKVIVNPTFLDNYKKEKGKVVNLSDSSIRRSKNGEKNRDDS